MKIILASSNAHKAKEINKILQNTGIEVITYKDTGIEIDDIVEDGKTFKENAYIQAKEIAKRVTLPVLSDDSGLVIDALDGFPGISTARFASSCNGYDNAMNELNNRLIGKDTKASFVCVLCLLNYKEEPLYFVGEVKGNIVKPINGDNGFGYDPAFKPLGYDKPFSLLDENIKNSISHRYKAIKQLMDYLIA